ncbi:MAG TPA: S1 RNA-binding domain-containing protein, partial [Symbiobacteriaceae bacterium]|nr:S1 RNA-binding domain-containing protein [Symbiobacteriaceae bacterium]
VPTVRDIIEALGKPGRDPRDELPKPIFHTEVLKMEDLQVGMELTGTVRNVVDFGAFVDIGVHEDGLVHVSQLSHKFIKHPSEAVAVGDIVKVRVIEVDLKRQRIGLTMKLGEPPAPEKRPERPAQPHPQPQQQKPSGLPAPTLRPAAQPSPAGAPRPAQPAPKRTEPPKPQGPSMDEQLKALAAKFNTRK